MAVRDINAIAAPTAGVASSEKTEVRGSRALTSTYFIDGVIKDEIISVRLRRMENTSRSLNSEK
jgi:hypothetical protein